MAEKTIYGYICKTDTNERKLKFFKDSIHSIQNPFIYTSNYVNTTTSSRMNLQFTALFNEELSDYFPDGFITDSGSIAYDTFFNNMIKMLYYKDSYEVNPPIDNVIWLNGIADESTGSFTPYVCKFNYVLDDDVLNFVITNSESSYIDYLPIEDHYFTVFDMDQTVDNRELYDMLIDINNEIGRENIYRGVAQFSFTNEHQTKYFYIFYSTLDVPNYGLQKELVKEYLIENYKKLGYDTIEELMNGFFKPLFDSSSKELYPMYENNKIPITYADVIDYYPYADERTEIIHVLDVTTPIIVATGISDVFPKYTERMSTNLINNKFLFFISTVLNYFADPVSNPLSEEFKRESGYTDFGSYVSVYLNAVEWQIHKQLLDE